MPASDPAMAKADWTREIRATLTLAWPLILSNLTMQAIQLTDAILMGWLGAAELASAALALSLTFTLSLFALGVLTASSPMMATALGKRSNSVRDVRRSFRQAMWGAAFMTVPIMIVLANAEAVILALGQEPELAAGAALFLKGYMWTIPTWLAWNVMRNFVSALERPGWILAINSAGIILNAVLGYGLIFGAFGLPAWGLFGGGLASAIVWFVMVLAMIVVIRTDRQFRRFHLFGNFWRPDWERFRTLFRLGVPIGMTMGFEGAVFGAATFLVGLFSVESVAAHQIAIQVAATTFMVPWGLSQATTVRVGLAYGRQDREAMGRAGWVALGLGVSFMAVMAIAMWIFPREIIHVFLDDTPENAPVIALGVSFVAVAAVFQIVDGAQVIGAGALRGLHDTQVPMFFALFGYWVVGIGVGTILAFALDWRAIGIWVGLASGLAAVAILMAWRWSQRERLGLTAI